MTPWDGDRDDVLVCRAVREETHDVRSFIFSAPEPRLFEYEPGQFLTFELEVGGQPYSRCYTLSSTPTRPYLVSITVKRVPGGPVSNWLHDTVRPGMRLRAVGPAGGFTCGRRPAGKYLFLSGGSGITPLMSMARTQDDLASEADIVFVHSARTPADIIFRAETALMARHRPHFRVVAVCEDDSQEGWAPGERWGGFRGRLSLPMLRLIAPDLLEREVFTCGPSPYMAAVRGMLGEAGFDTARYHEESFDFAELARSEPEIPQEIAALEEGALEAGKFKVEFTKSRRSVACGADTTVAAGMRLPFSCTKGICGTCKSRLASGTVDMRHGGGIRPREIDQGMILICCSRPTSNLVVER